MAAAAYQRKADDNDIVNLNNVGLSLCGIARRLSGVPVLRDADRPPLAACSRRRWRCRPTRRASIAAAAARAASAGTRTRREPDRRPVDSPAHGGRADTRPDQAGRGRSAGWRARSCAASRRAGSTMRAARSWSRSTATLAEQHYAEHAEKPFFGELVDVHHLVADARARARGRGRDRGRPLDDGLDEPGRLAARARSAATSRSRCRTTSSTARTRRSRRAREIALWFPTMSSSDALRATARAWDRISDEYQARNAEFIGRRPSRAGACGSCPSPSSDPRRRRRARTCSSSAAARRSGRSCSRGAARGSWASTTRRGSSSTPAQLMAAAGVDFPLVHAARRRCRCRTRASTSSSATTAR